MMHRALPLLVLGLIVPARAVIVQGRVTSPLGRPVAGARVELIALSGGKGQGARAVADGFSAADGTYEIRTGLSGRFLLLTSSTSFAPQLGVDFYAGRTNLIRRDIVLDPVSITPLLSGVRGEPETPLAQLADAVEQAPADHLQTRAFLARELPLAPAVILLERGEKGGDALLSLRGADPDANAVLLDGASIQRLGGFFNFAKVASTGLAGMAWNPAAEVAPGPNPLYPLSGEEGTIALHTARAANTHPALVYSGDAGNLQTWRDEAAVSLTHSRTDVFAIFSRFDTSNTLPDDRFHSVASDANLGYAISANTSLRFILRNEDSAGALPIPHNLGLMPSTRRADQDLYGTFTFETRTAGNWHNLVRYGIVRSRGETFIYSNPAGYATIIGANGYVASGVSAPFPLPSREDRAGNRDEARYETDYALTRWLSSMMSASYRNERALDAVPGVRQTLERTDLAFAGSLRGELKHRVFMEASGGVARSSLSGFVGSPRLGMTYVPVLGRPRRFRGTALHLAVATGSREASLAEQAQNIVVPARARTLDVSADQNLYGERLVLHAGYFHNQFSHQTEALSMNAPAGGIGPTLSGGQAFRTQGFVSELRFQPKARLLIGGGYTYLASLVERTAETAVYNPSLPEIAVGATTALGGQRMFQRPPHSGFFTVSYAGRVFGANVEGSLAGRADDSTFASGSPALLLPNRNLDHGYVRLDASFTYAILRHVTLFSQLTNLLNERHIGPIAFPSAPFAIRSGLKLRIGGD